METRSPNLTILYGSQTGNAEDLAKRIGSRFRSKCFRKVVVQTMDDFPLKLLPKLTYALFVCSTTGHGQEPENMKNFYNFIRRRDLPKDCLSNLKYAVYGLGDSSYARFNYVSKVLFRRLKECGAVPLQDLVIGDEQHRLGLDGDIYPGLEELELLLSCNGGVHSATPLVSCNSYTAQIVSRALDNKVPLIDDNFKAKTNLKVAVCVTNQRVTSNDHFQDSRFLQFRSDELLNYEPGDVCTILPQNPDESVEQFIELLNLDPNQPVALRKNDPEFMINYLYDFIPEGILIRDLVKCYLDIHSVPRRSFYEILSLFSDNELEKEKLKEFSTTEGQEEMYEYCIQPKRSILEVLLDFPHTVKNIKFDFIFDLVPPIKPRSFSIASAPTSDPYLLDLIVGVVKYKTRLRKTRKGLCSNYLAQLTTSADSCNESNQKSQIQFYLQRTVFKLPLKANIPIIMIGPGLGIAPFRSFIQYRVDKDCATESNTQLYFGCRYKRSDYYFQNELEEYQDQLKIRLRVAFSRESSNHYVQDLLLEDGELMIDTIKNKSASIYIAGNSKLPEDIRSILAKLLAREVGDTDNLEGYKEVAELEQQGRILYDCW